ncbi:DUF2892 domain-containing protein [Salibacterium salarium]|uniref:DUF2892 domain-containing protein n=1 Tax=Salibacterium salarium TaxID=284579 RepID=A0A3R9PA89_9BACI|nr:DUF2892 domain-containing protein [Salibacterium salarium]RSL33881.1 DUF2892 domain-containing protein [Salibacterium salarium]
MKSNIGTINALIRITCGLTVLSWATADWSRSRHNNMHMICTILGAMKVAEGITRFCPVTKWITDSMPNTNHTEASENTPDYRNMNE